MFVKSYQALADGKILGYQRGKGHNSHSDRHRRKQVQSRGVKGRRSGRGARPCCLCNGLVREVGPAAEIDHLCGGLIVRGQRLLVLGIGRSVEDGHCSLQTLGASRLGASRQRDTQGEIVRIGVGRGRGVCDGVGEAVVILVVLLTASFVEGIIGE